MIVPNNDATAAHDAPLTPRELAELRALAERAQSLAMPDRERGALVSEFRQIETRTEKEAAKITKDLDAARKTEAEAKAAFEKAHRRTLELESRRYSVTRAAEARQSRIRRELVDGLPPEVEETRRALDRIETETRHKGITMGGHEKRFMPSGGVDDVPTTWNRPSLERRFAYIVEARREIRDTVPLLPSRAAIVARLEELLEGVPSLELERIA